ncbi:MAG: FAD-dependent oxidoreductase, partial [Dehalococcoidia bacterium]
MLIAVIGAGAAGLTAAHRLQQAGHQVAVFEARPFVGGRTHTESFGPGHHLDTGAGWLTSAYTRTLALLDELGMRERMHPLRASAPAELCVDGHSFNGAGQPRVADEASPLVPTGEQQALHAWLRDLRQYPQDLSTRLEHDGESAEQHLAPVSPQAARYIFGPLFEGLFAPLAEQSAEFLRSWVASGRATYWQLDDGMDAPWKAVAAHLDVRLDEPVLSVRRAIGGLEVVSQRSSGLFDGVVVAAPPPVAAHAIERALTPPWYQAISYSGQCRLYVARRGDGPPEPVHFRPLPMGLIASVEWQSGSLGAWGACPPGTEWVLICANQQHNNELL